MNIKYLTGLVMAALLTVVTACDKKINPEESWQQTVSADTSKAYNDFLEKFPNHPKAPDALRALRETVLIPYLGYVGSGTDQPPLDKLKIPEQVLANPASAIFDNTTLITTASFPTISINGHTIKLAKPHYNGKEIETVEFGKLRCALAQTGLGDKSQTMIFYLGGIRSQREKIIAHVIAPVSTKAK